MARASAADFVRWWPAPPGTSHHQRTVRLMCALDGPSAAQVSLGAHHQRLLGLHQELLGTPLEGTVTCQRCGADNEFLVPVGEILAAASPPPTARVVLRVGRRSVAFRLPTVDDLAATTAATSEDGVRRLAEATRLDPGPRLGKRHLEELVASWESEDPAGAVRLDLECAECDLAMSVHVDPAEFVARDFDRLVDRLMGEVHVIASAYGWDEVAVLALPEARRRRYVAMITAHAAAEDGGFLRLAAP